MYAFYAGYIVLIKTPETLLFSNIWYYNSQNPSALHYIHITNIFKKPSIRKRIWWKLWR